MIGAVSPNDVADVPPQRRTALRLAPRRPLDPPPAGESLADLLVWTLRELRVWREMTLIGVERIGLLEQNLRAARHRNVALKDELARYVRAAVTE